MTVKIQDELNAVLINAGLQKDASLAAMHLSEIEEEAENVLDILTAVRSHVFRQDSEITQESLAELTIVLEHMLHHVQAVVPLLQEALDLEPD